MSAKVWVFLGATIGTILGSFIPNLWGANLLSFSSVLLGGVGGIIGVIVTYKMLD